MTLLPLPLEVLQHVAAYVDLAHRPSLCALSLTSKACHEAAVFLVFQHIVITVHNREGLRRDVDRLVEALSYTDSPRHVQRITIKGALRLSHREKREGYGRDLPWLATGSLHEILSDETPIGYGGPYCVYDEGVIETSSEEDMAWAPIVNFLQNQTHLKDLVYICQSQFPPSLLRTLYKRQPQCRLHCLTFRFRTLFWDVPKPYEMELATSPSLYRIDTACAQRDTDSDDDFNLEAVMELVTGLAPNLKEVNILTLLPAGSFKFTRPRESWQGLPGFTSGKRGSLTSLSLRGHSWPSPQTMLQGWASHTDFTCLQRLILGDCYNASGFGLSGEIIEWIIQNHSFPRVKTLVVVLTRDDAFHERPRYSEHAASFFLAFESLDELSVGGSIDSQILDTILLHHGRTLRKLTLHSSEETSNYSNGRHRKHIPFQFTKNSILQIEAQCPILEKLAIAIKRDKSSASEAEIYRCFSQMKSLRSLFLNLDCSNWRVTRDSMYNPKFDKEEQKPIRNSSYPLKKGELKKNFINCAVDEALAHSIWNIISQNKTGRQLERLKLWTTGAGEYGVPCLFPGTGVEIAWNMTRSWLFERSPQIDREDVTIKELSQQEREARDEGNVGYLTQDRHPDVWEVFRSIWPPKEGSKDWREDWSSFPLAI